MYEIYLLMLLTGLTGGIGHCLGMCGPIVASFGMALPGSRLLPHLLYHAGRITTYMLLGGLLGFGTMFGNFFLQSGLAGFSCCGPGGSFSWVQKLPLLTAGVLIVLMGLSTAGLLPLGRTLERCGLEFSLTGKIMPFFANQSGIGFFYPLGLVLGFIPCALVYSALLTVIRVGLAASDPIAGLFEGMSLMLLFGLGTGLPLLMFGQAVSLLGERTRQRFYRLAGILVIVMGILFLVRVFR